MLCFAFVSVQYSDPNCILAEGPQVLLCPVMSFSDEKDDETESGGPY